MNTANMTDREVRHIERRSAARAILAAVIVAGIVTFATINRHDVEVDFLVDAVDAALWIVIALSAAAGMVIGALLGWRRAR
jgi:uncharacterized integral membrane protein